MQIEHDPKEPPRDRSGMGIYWANFLILCVLWAWKLLDGLDWQSVALGLWTGLFVAIWAIEMTGNKVPAWMRR
jgi:hypothetical protein